ncbi:MAG: hypothetical protein BWY71_02171 [Planctomycetes bacterium ADurb.Bin412]|nr:MAG: hypothetical protein BWY71_02171 [Planctomycetes bacterium ADurb.Bin412]
MVIPQFHHHIIRSCKPAGMIKIDKRIIPAGCGGMPQKQGRSADFKHISGPFKPIEQSAGIQPRSPVCTLGVPLRHINLYIGVGRSSDIRPKSFDVVFKPERPRNEIVRIFVMMDADIVNQIRTAVKERIIPTRISASAAAGNQFYRHAQIGRLGPHRRSKLLHRLDILGNSGCPGFVVNLPVSHVIRFRVPIGSPHSPPGCCRRIAVAVFHPVQSVLQIFIGVQLKFGRRTAGAVENARIDHQQRL